MRYSNQIELTFSGIPQKEHRNLDGTMGGGSRQRDDTSECRITGRTQQRVGTVAFIIKRRRNFTLKTWFQDFQNPKFNPRFGIQ